MTEKDVEDVVRVHLASFPDFFASEMGGRVLKVYYSSLVRAGNPAFVLVAEGAVVGFVTGFLAQRDASNIWLLNAPSFALAAARELIAHPLLVLRTVRRLVERFRVDAQRRTREDGATLSSIAVLPSWRGHGRADDLMRQFISAVSAKGCTKVYLETDADENERINAFYARNGFQLERVRITSEGRRLNDYVYEL